MKKKIDRYSSENQRILDDFVNQNVYANVNQMVEFILQSEYELQYGCQLDAPFTNDDVLNLETYSFRNDLINIENCVYNDFDNIKSELEDFVDELKTSDLDADEKFLLNDYLSNYGYDRQGGIYDVMYICEQVSINDLEETLNDLEQVDSDYAEVFTWYMVSDFLAAKLLEHGEVIIDRENIWGRCTFGQAIAMDGVIGDIAEELGLLK